MLFYDLHANVAPVTAEKAKEIFGDSKSTFYAKVAEIRELMTAGRYNRYAILQDGKIRVNYFVYYDYTVYRMQLRNPCTAKYVPDFEPREIAEITPVNVLHEVV